MSDPERQDAYAVPDTRSFTEPLLPSHFARRAQSRRQVVPLPAVIYRMPKAYTPVMGFTRAMLVAICLGATAECAALPDAVLSDGFEPACYGTANDRPGCIVVPFNQPPLTPTYATSSQAAWNRVDLYALLDRSGSMSTEISSIRNNLSTVVRQLQCEPAGTGAAGACIEDLWAGAGTFAYSGSDADAYRHYSDLRPNPDFASLPITEPVGCCSEVTWFALYSAITGLGGAGCPSLTTVARANCTTSPAGAEGTGYACFRPDAASFVILSSDERPSLNFTCPTWSTVVRPEYLARGARVATAYGSGVTADTITEFQGLATDTGAVDALNGNAPIVVSGADTNAATAIRNAILSFRAGTPMAVRAEVLDDPNDSFDVAAFVQRVEVVNDGSNGCPNAAGTDDGDGDGFADTFLALLPGAKFCFRVITMQNQTAPATSGIQLFPATLRFIGDVQMTIAEIKLTFAVPGTGG